MTLIIDLDKSTGTDYYNFIIIKFNLSLVVLLLLFNRLIRIIINKI